MPGQLERVRDGRDYRRGQYRYIKGWTYGSNDRGEIVGNNGAEAFVARLP